MTERPYIGSGFLMVWPPTSEQFASFTISAPPRKMAWISSTLRMLSGMPAIAMAVMGLPPMA